MECCHNNGDKLDNKLKNLRWDTYSSNACDASKLTEQKVRTIMSMYKTGKLTQQEIANLYNIGQDVVSRIVNKKTWKYLWRN